MASTVSTVQYICDQAGVGRRLTFRKMFGEYALYLDGKVVALICDDQLFLKPTPEGKAYLGKVLEAPPYPGAKHFYLLSSMVDDPDRLSKAFQITAQALPEPRPTSARSRSIPKEKANPKSEKEGAQMTLVPPGNQLQRKVMEVLCEAASFRL